MSRGGGRGRRGGAFGGRGGFGANNLPPMGLTFSDIQNLSREENEMYPPMDPLPVLNSYTDEEKHICELQLGFAQRLGRSAYYIVEHIKSTELPKYSDKYRPSPAMQPVLRRRDLHQPFFPTEIFEGYFNVRKHKKESKKLLTLSKINLDDLADDADDNQEKSGGEHSDAGSERPDSDYDVDEEYDNDYAENYFDNGEEEDIDDVGGGGDDGGGGDYD